MGIARYLAMTADEFANAPSHPKSVAWMACHFSPYSAGLTNIPKKLPANSLLILNDSTPPSGQSPIVIAKELEYSLKKWNCYGLLLDFQREGCAESLAIIKELLKLEFPVCVSETYAKDLDCPVFLPPLPLTTPLSEYISPWQNRQIWLDTALSCQGIAVTENGSKEFPVDAAGKHPLEDKALHCHYSIVSKQDGFYFTLQRTKQDLDDLLAEADELGITLAVGLYQELK